MKIKIIFAPFDDRENGTSLIELILAASMLGMVALGAAQLFKRMGTSEYESRAKAAATLEAAQFAGAIERDLKVRDKSKAAQTPLCVNSPCSEFSFQSKVRTGNAANEDLTIAFQTRCAAIPVSMRGKIKDLNRPFDPKLATHQGQCLLRAKCKASEYPYIFFAFTDFPKGAKLPTYPRTSGASGAFPSLTKEISAAQSIVGAAICADSSQSTDRIAIETAFLTSEGDFRVERKEVAVPRSNIAGIQLLPNGPGSK